MIALPMLIIWVIGLPIAMFMVLKLHTKDQHNDEMRFRFGMLMEGYEDEYFYWESVIASRKALVMMISVFMATLSARCSNVMWSIGSVGLLLVGILDCSGG